MDNNGLASVVAFEELFDLDVRVEETGKSGRCSNPTNDGCSSVHPPRTGPAGVRATACRWAWWEW